MINNRWQGFLVTFASVLFINTSVFAETTNPKITMTAVFAGGCFWCMEPPFEALPGVISAVSGYSGGQTENPNYEEVSNGKTGHLESVQVTYDPTKVSYEKLLEVFWQNIDPFDDKGQFCDKGEQYKAAIFYQNDKEKQLAEASKLALQHNLKNNEIVTELRPAGKFFPAEDYHQNYYLTNAIKYKFYRYTCGRDKRLKQIWH